MPRIFLKHNFVLMNLENRFELHLVDFLREFQEHLCGSFLSLQNLMTLIFREINPLFEKGTGNEQAALVDEALDLLSEESVLGTA